MNVTVSQWPIGASLTKRSPRRFQPLSRTMLVVTAVSSINTRWAGSRKPCSRIQRRRARATSARLRSAGRRLFFDGDAMTGEEAGQRATTSWDSPLVKRRNNLIECKIALRADECENLPRMLLQGRNTPSARRRFASPVFAKALHPPDRRTDANLELFRGPIARRPGRVRGGRDHNHPPLPRRRSAESMRSDRQVRRMGADGALSPRVARTPGPRRRHEQRTGGGSG